MRCLIVNVMLLSLGVIGGGCSPDSEDVAEAAADVISLPSDAALDTSDMVDDAAPTDSGSPGDVEPAVDIEAVDIEAVDIEAADIEAADIEALSDDVEAPPDEVEATCPAPRPVLLVHGINGSSANYAVMVERLIADGWPQDFIFLFDAKDPAWGCNVDNAAAIDALVDDIMETTGHDRLDLVAHSMGTLSSRHWVKNMGGAERLNTYVTMGGMHHGLASPCWAPEFLGVCVWQELCETGEMVTQLNAEPSTPGPVNWVTMYGTADTAIPNESSQLDGAENLVFEGVEHSGPAGLLELVEVYDEVKRVLEYPCW